MTTITEQKKFLLLNPIVGPEAITGSSRMKGGTATKIVLDILFSHALSAVTGVALPVAFSDARTMLERYEKLLREVYAHTESIGKIVQRAGESCLSHCFCISLL
jgi:adenylosuccinate lyase